MPASAACDVKHAHTPSGRRLNGRHDSTLCTHRNTVPSKPAQSATAACPTRQCKGRTKAQAESTCVPVWLSRHVYDVNALSLSTAPDEFVRAVRFNPYRLENQRKQWWKRLGRALCSALCVLRCRTTCRRAGLFIPPVSMRVAAVAAVMAALFTASHGTAVEFNTRYDEESIRWQPYFVFNPSKCVLHPCLCVLSPAPPCEKCYYSPFPHRSSRRF